MRHVLAATLMLFSFVSLVATPARAQAPARRGGNFNRVNSPRPQGAAAPSRQGRVERSYVETSLREAAPADPLRPYSSRAGDLADLDQLSSLGTRRPRAVIPEEPAPERPAVHTYYPALRPGQGPNRNTFVAGTSRSVAVFGAGRGHCTPGRASFVARGAVGMGMGMATAPSLPAPASLGMPGR